MKWYLKLKKERKLKKRDFVRLLTRYEALKRMTEKRVPSLSDTSTANIEMKNAETQMELRNVQEKGVQVSIEQTEANESNIMMMEVLMIGGKN